MRIVSNNLSDVLFSKARPQVLGLLYGHPGQSFHTNEIIRMTKTGTGAIQRELKQLSASGLLVVKSVGNQKHYLANHNSPLFSELHSIVLKTVGLANALRTALSSIASQIEFAFVYGSIAKQEETASSDIDVMIIANDLTYADLFKLLEPAQIQLGRQINPTFYSPLEWVRKKNSGNNFLSQIIKQPKIFLIGNDDELGKLG